MRHLILRLLAPQQSKSIRGAASCPPKPNSFHYVQLFLPLFSLDVYILYTVHVSPLYPNEICNTQAAVAGREGGRRGKNSRWWPPPSERGVKATARGQGVLMN